LATPRRPEKTLVRLDGGRPADGGGVDYGTVFQINTNGNGFSLLSAFGGANGNQPYGALALSGSTLYGMTRLGGTSNLGIVYRMNLDGSGFTILHEFAGGGADGSNPYGELTLVSSTLYGMTFSGGDNNYGTIFTYTIPEPSTLVLAGLGLLGLLACHRRR
jgi:uncharacterized repeat protein (TIGR03803 family)